MNDRPPYTAYPFQRYSTELLIVILIICILAVLALKSYLPYLERAKLFHVVGGSPYSAMKPDMMLFHALHGRWPGSNEDALRNGWSEKYDESSLSYIKEASIENGAIHFRLTKELGGKILTIRPARPANDSLGPVVWVVGKQTPPPMWSVQGVDKTTVDDRFIGCFKPGALHPVSTPTKEH